MKTLFNNFNPGDLLYGLTPARQGIQPLLQKKVGSGIPVTVDQCNNTVVVRLWDDVNKYDPTQKNQQKYIRWLAGVQLTIENQPIYQRSYLQKHYKCLLDPGYSAVSITNNEFKKSNKTLTHFDRKIRRACKARLLDNDTPIHFILSGISVEATFNRSYSLQDKENCRDVNNIYDTHTSAELRFLLKHFEVAQYHIKYYVLKEGDYVTVNLFDWLASQNTMAKKAVLAWATTRETKGKLAAATLERIKQAVTSESKHADHSISGKKELCSTPPKKPLATQPKYANSPIPLFSTVQPVNTIQTPATPCKKRGGSRYNL